MEFSLIMLVHALIGTAVVFSGAAALLLKKGSSYHRYAGRFFVGLLSSMGFVIAAQFWLEPGGISSLGVLFVIFIVYLVVSAWSTIRKPERVLTQIDYLSPFVAVCLSIACLVVGISVVGNPSSGPNSAPNEAYFFFAFLALAAGLLDANHLRIGGVSGSHRIVRHVWRMMCALFFATSTLFTGPGAIIFPESVRGNFVLAIPQFLVIALALFWIVRLLFSKQRGGLKNL